MQVETPNGPFVVEEQTIHPFTSQTRMFNQKEANANGACISKIRDPNNTIGSDLSLNSALRSSIGQQVVNLPDVYSNEQEKRREKFNQDLFSLVKDKDNRKGVMNLDSNNVIVNDDGSVITQVYNARLLHDPVPQYTKMPDFPEPYIDPENPDIVHNEMPNEYSYNSYADWRAPTFNQWTRLHDDICNEDNRLRIGSKPMKYYVNQYNTPQIDPYFEYTIIGNQKQYDVRNDFERPIPTRLNPLYPSQVEPYATTPFLGSTNPSRLYSDTSSSLRWGNDSSVRDRKSMVALAEIDYNRFDIVSEKTVQNAGQFNSRGNRSSADFYYDYNEPNHVIFGNSSNIDQFGIPTRSYLRNFVDFTGTA